MDHTLEVCAINPTPIQKILGAQWDSYIIRIMGTVGLKCLYIHTHINKYARYSYMDPLGELNLRDKPSNALT